MVRYKGWTENERKSVHCPEKKLKNLQKAWKTIAQDHIKILQECLAAWKQNIKKEWLRTFAQYCV